MDLSKIEDKELLKMKAEIDKQLLENSTKVKIRKTKKECLSDLVDGDEIFCINFSGSKIYDMDYVMINFYDNNLKWTKFSTDHRKKSLGCGSSLLTECMSQHCFLSDFLCNMYFLTMKPESWKEDIKSEVSRIIMNKEKLFQEEIKKIEGNIDALIISGEVDKLIVL
jgi:hypothetical protein